RRGREPQRYAAAMHARLACSEVAPAIMHERPGRVAVRTGAVRHALTLWRVEREAPDVLAGQREQRRAVAVNVVHVERVPAAEQPRRVGHLARSRAATPEGAHEGPGRVEDLQRELAKVGDQYGTIGQARRPRDALQRRRRILG